MGNPWEAYDVSVSGLFSSPDSPISFIPKNANLEKHCASELNVLHNLIMGEILVENP